MNALTTIKGFVGEHSPALLVGAGIIGFGVTIVLACKATTKLDAILDESKKKEDQIMNFNAEDHDDIDYTELDREKDLKINRRNTRYKVAKAYAIPAAIGLASVTSILVGFKILRGRYLLMASSYATLEKVYDKYRDRIRTRYGEDADYYGRTGIERITEKVVDPETGEEKEVKRNLYSVIPEEFKDNPFCYLIGPGDWLYDRHGGDMKMIESQITAYQVNWNRRIASGEYINMNSDILESIFPGDMTKKTDLGQVNGKARLTNDPDEKYELDMNFQVIESTSMDGTKDILYGMICPNVQFVSFADLNKFRNNFIQNAGKVKVRRKGGKYISQSEV